MTAINWIELDGVVNMRDVGGIPTTDGAAIAPGRLLRSDNLQDLTVDDVAALRARGVTDVVDLRSDTEVTSTGPGPLHSEPWVQIHHVSFFDTFDSSSLPDPPETGAPDEALPQVGRQVDSGDGFTAHYLSYLHNRPDAVVSGLRVITDSHGATLVHCAAGKDRTGTLVAIALLLAGAEPDAVIADYAASSERIEQILARLVPTPTYGPVLGGQPAAWQMTHPEIMAAFIDTVMPDGDRTQLAELLGAHGWTEADTARLRARLRG